MRLSTKAAAIRSPVLLQAVGHLDDFLDLPLCVIHHVFSFVGFDCPFPSASRAGVSRVARCLRHSFTLDAPSTVLPSKGKQAQHSHYPHALLLLFVFKGVGLAKRDGRQRVFLRWLEPLCQDNRWAGIG